MFRCKKDDNTYTMTTWKYYTAQCTRIQQALSICSGISGAYLPAITVCNQRLFWQLVEIKFLNGFVEWFQQSHFFVDMSRQIDYDFWGES